MWYIVCFQGICPQTTCIFWSAVMQRVMQCRPLWSFHPANRRPRISHCSSKRRGSVGKLPPAMQDSETVLKLTLCWIVLMSLASPASSTAPWWSNPERQMSIGEQHLANEVFPKATPVLGWFLYTLVLVWFQNWFCFHSSSFIFDGGNFGSKLTFLQCKF